MKRKEVNVPYEEIERQKEFISKVKENNVGLIKKYTISTFGCAMNQHDSEKLAGMLSEMGFIETEDVNESNLIIFNTCCVRDSAEQKVYGHLGALKKMRGEKEDLLIAVCGCMMQQSEVVEKIKSKYRQVDLIFGTHNLHKFPELIFQTKKSKRSIIDIWDIDGYIAEDVPIERKDGIKAYVTIMYGCNNFCAYCIVPYVRGRERSRKVEDIVKEVTELGLRGCKEVTLLGQNVNSYGKDFEQAVSFAKLLEEINKIDGIERIRFLTSHPKDLSDELIDAVKNLSKVCEGIHLPVQSGNTKVLNEMNRKYSKEQYLDLVNKIKAKIPDVVITTDIIVGFPGETDEEFEDTLDVISKSRYDMAYTFLYSKRTGTPAATRKEQVPEDAMKIRFDKLVELQNTISKESNEKYNGRIVEVLVEGLSKNSDEMHTGRTRGNKLVHFKGDDSLIGKLVNVKINHFQTWSLEGEIIK